MAKPKLIPSHIVASSFHGQIWSLHNHNASSQSNPYTQQYRVLMGSMWRSTKSSHSSIT
jgi:hypothetical protein